MASNNVDFPEERDALYLLGTIWEKLVFLRISSIAPQAALLPFDQHIPSDTLAVQTMV